MCSVKEGVLKNFGNFTVPESFLINMQGPDKGVFL